MKLEDQVCSLELAKRLKEIGVKQESYFYYTTCNDCTKEYGSQEWSLEEGISHGENISAFTIAELGEMLPSLIGPDLDYYLKIDKVKDGWLVAYVKNDNLPPLAFYDGTKEADVRSKLLIHLIENKLIETRNTQ